MENVRIENLRKNYIKHLKKVRYIIKTLRVLQYLLFFGSLALLFAMLSTEKTTYSLLGLCMFILAIYEIVRIDQKIKQIVLLTKRNG